VGDACGGIRSFDRFVGDGKGVGALVLTGQRNLEIAESVEVQGAAQLENRAFTDGTFGCQLGDGHIENIVGTVQDVFGHLFFGGIQRTQISLDPGQAIRDDGLVGNFGPAG
jgi:hypothetical protein